MNELEQLTEACLRMGAERPQAATMAAQLLKRAAQLAAERGVTRETALASLLQLVVQARTGGASVDSPVLPSGVDSGVASWAETPLTISSEKIMITKNSFFSMRQHPFNKSRKVYCAGCVFVRFLD